MRIEYDTIEEITLEEFADKHDLVMEIGERPYPEGDDGRYWAVFKDTAIKEGIMLVGRYGNGPTPEAAMDDYRRRISLKRLVVNEFSADRRTVFVPRLRNVC